MYLLDSNTSEQTVSPLKSAQIRFRFILPGVYLFIAGILFLCCLLSMMHSVWCERFLSSMFPAQWLARRLIDVVVAKGMPSQRSEVWKLFYFSLTLPIPFGVTIAQYFLLGLTVDKLIARARR